MNEILSYLIRFLLGDEGGAAVGYTADRGLFSRYALAIVPSGFFDAPTYGAPASLPSLPLKEIDGVPFLFGEAREERIGRTQVIYADLIASAYFLLTRYEELARRQVRDAHGRFPGKESLPFRAGFIHRPVVDEYGLLLRRRLGWPPPEPGIRQVFLTHDVDAPFLYRSWKGLLRSILDGRGLVRSIGGKFGPAGKSADPYYTFPRLFEEDRRIAGARSIFFIKAGGRTLPDKPRYNLRNKDVRRLIDDIRRQGGEIGLHASYEAGIRPGLIAAEKARLERFLGSPVACNRHHFLASREPEDMDQLERLGFTGDFSLGYADVAGFRLGTCRPVRRINPLARRLGALCLHPLTVMDCTLEERKYMGLSFEEASGYCLRLAGEARRMGGEFTLLWHNTSLAEGSDSYLGRLYDFLITQLTDK
jgi:hypothetical protein